MWVLSGIGVVVLGFLIRLNPLLVVAVAALVTGLAADRRPIEILAAFGKAFNESRFVSVVFSRVARHRLIGARGEDVFVAVGSVLPIVGFLQQSGVMVQPLSLSLWAIPTAIIAFLIHGARLLLLDRTLKHEQAKTPQQDPVE